MRRDVSSQLLLGLFSLSLLLAAPTTTALRFPSLGRSSLTSLSFPLPDKATPATLRQSSMSTDSNHDSVDSVSPGPQAAEVAATPASPLSASFYRNLVGLGQPDARIPRRKFLRALLAEALGTGMIVFFGTGAVMSAVVGGELVGLFQIAAVWIIAVTLAIATTANISGAHLNPAITLAFFLLRKFPRAKVVPYMVAQMVGSGLASWMNYMLYASKISAMEAAQGIVRSSAGAIGTAKCFGEYYLHPVTTAQAFLAEAFGTAVLAFCIFCLTHHRNDTTIHNVYVPPLIGATVGGLISVLAPLTQAGVRDGKEERPAWSTPATLVSHTTRYLSRL
jgi:glycerol uptake facilitator protein